MNRMNSPSSQPEGQPTQQGFRVFSTAISLALAEFIFWIAIVSVWYSVQQIAPNIQIERREWWPILLILPSVLGIFIWSINRKQRMAKLLADASIWPTILQH